MPLTHIDRFAFVDALKSLGIDTTGLYAVESDVKSITLKRRAAHQAPNGQTHLVETTETLPLIADMNWLDD